MRLIGMLDSPYVRRVAISLQLLGLGFEHRPVSVFRAFDEFQAINPVVKAPSLVCDDGTVLMDSNLMLEYAEGLAQAQGGRSLMPQNLASRQADLRIIGLALAACEKAVQFIYEHNLRPPEKLHEPWVARVTGQLQAAFAGLEAEVARRPPAATTAQITQAGITSAVTWHFTQALVPELVPAARFPTLAAFAAKAAALPAFKAAPHGDGTCVPGG
jgi:glutathione S-transferase